MKPMTPPDPSMAPYYHDMGRMLVCALMLYVLIGSTLGIVAWWRGRKSL